MAKTTVSQLWDEATRVVEDEVRDYFINAAYLEGHQWWEWDEVNLEVAPPLIEEEADRIQATMNHTRANTRTLIAQLTQRELTFWVKPEAYDDATKAGARLGMKLLEARRRDANWEQKREEHVWAAWAGGTGVLMVEWSEANEEPVETVLSIANVRVEPGSTDWESARWVIKQQLLPPRTVQGMYPDVYKDAPPRADAKAGLQATSAYRLSIDDHNVPLTRVLTYYERPSPLNEKGRMLVEIDGKIIEHGDWPFPWNHKLNIAVIRETVQAERGHGTTVLTDMQSPQVALNGAWSVFLEALRDASTNILVIDESWEDQIDEITDRPGDVMSGRTRDGIRAPFWLTAPPVAQTVVEGVAMLKDTLDDLSGVHDVSRGQAPANIESGYGLSILAEKDSSPVGRLIKETAHAWTWVGEMELRLLAHYVKKNKKTEGIRKPWKGSDLRDQVRAEVPLDAIVPRSQAAMQQFAMEALQMGLIPEGPMAPIMVAQLAEMPDQRGVIAAISPHADKAIRENEELANGEVPMPAPFDDDAIHIELLIKFMVSEEFTLLSAAEQNNCMNHLKAHETQAAQKVGSRRQGANVDPALANAPRADGAPPIEPLPMEGMPGPGPAPEALPGPEELPPEVLPEEAMDPSATVDQMMSAMEEGI